MTQRKILLYGGCHALVLRDLIATHFGDRAEASLLVNFELIGRGEPFPYESLRNYDAVAFSPIENKGDYNTHHLVDACRAVGVDAICFPWLEWQGYCPGALKGEFKNRYQWRYLALIEAAARFERFELFCEWVETEFPTDKEVDDWFDYSTTRMYGAEKRHDMPIRIADFILDRFRDQRLFLLSDHPSLALYAHVMRQLLPLLGIEDGGRCDLIERECDEPQRGWSTPILPRVAQRLGLRFQDSSWVDDEVVPGRSVDLHSYLKLYYYSDSVILGPVDNAEIMPVKPGAAVSIVGPATRLVADRRAANLAADREAYRLLDVLSGDGVPLHAHQHFEIDQRQWRSEWG